ncbi:MAG TPA: hypothetical protein VIV40_41730 [Kofleriaceae bacterium]
MRCAVIVALAGCAGCGDNEPACGHAEVLNWDRNIWGGHIAVDGERVYYSDYANAVGTHLVFRQPRDGGQALVIAARGETSRFGYGMVVDDGHVYWSGENEPVGYTLFATPPLGGRTIELSAISVCTGHGVAVDSVNAYAGSIRCNDGIGNIAAHVIAVPHLGGPSTELWSSLDADVSDLAAVGGDVFIATTRGLVRVSPAGTELLDGRATYHVEIANDNLVYSTEEMILSRPLAGGAARTLYTFHTPINQPRAFALEGDDMYIVEPPRLLYTRAGSEPTVLVEDTGAAITHVVARDGAAYWATLAVPGSLGLFGTFSGGVLRALRPCQ